MNVTIVLFSLLCLGLINLIILLAWKEIDRKSDGQQAKRNKNHSICSLHPQTFPHPKSDPIREISPGYVWKPFPTLWWTINESSPNSFNCSTAFLQMHISFQQVKCWAWEKSFFIQFYSLPVREVNSHYQKIARKILFKIADSLPDMLAVKALKTITFVRIFVLFLFG